MKTKFYKIAGQTIKYDGNMTTIPALRGEGVSRFVGKLTLHWINGEFCDAYGEPITVSGETTLMGWGCLSGPAYDLNNGATVSKKVWDELNRLAAV